MLHLRPHRSLAPLRRLLRPRLVQQPALAGPHRRRPRHLPARVLRPLADALAAGVPPHLPLAAVQHQMRVRHVRTVRRRRRQTVRQTRLGVDADVRLHAEVPLVPLLPLVHLPVPLAVLVLRRTRRVDDARVHDRPSAQPVVPRRQMRVDLLEQRRAQTAPLQQVPEVQDRRLVRQRTQQPQTREAPHRLRLVQQILHRGIAQVVEQLRAVNAKHHRQRVRPPAPARLRIECLHPPSNSGHGTNASIFDRNLSRRVVRFFALCSRSAKLACRIRHPHHPTRGFIIAETGICSEVP